MTMSPMAAPVLDVAVRGGRIVDGTGGPAYHADVGIRRGRIVAIGRHVPPARLELSAEGCVVAPGFVDVHTHGENILDLPLAENFIRQGVTTIVVGNCGSSPADIRAFLRKVGRLGTGPNVAVLVGLGTVREKAMGGSFNRPPTAEEMERMRRMVDAGMRAGALGVSTGLIYQPGSFATTEEIIELARVAARYDGIYTSHMRSESSAIADALAEVFRIAEEAGIRCEISHIKVSGQHNWGRAREVLDLIEGARRRGLDITQDQYVYTASSTGLSQLVPSWAREGGTEAFQRRLENPVERSRMEAEMRQALARRRQPGYAWVVLAGCPHDPELNGLSVPDAARLRRGSDELYEQIALILDIEAKGGAAAVFHGISEEDLQVFLRHPNTMLGSDSGVREFGKDVPHPRGYGNHVRVLARYVRELGVLTLEDAVRKMTLLPATTFRLQDRGMVRVGAAADLVVFDPATVADTATFGRPHSYAEGVRHVLVSGVPVVQDGRTSGARPGKPLKRS